jgi:hypothetical protein
MQTLRDTAYRRSVVIQVDAWYKTISNKAIVHHVDSVVGKLGSGVTMLCIHHALAWHVIFISNGFSSYGTGNSFNDRTFSHVKDVSPDTWRQYVYRNQQRSDMYVHLILLHKTRDDQHDWSFNIAPGYLAAVFTQVFNMSAIYTLTCLRVPIQTAFCLEQHACPLMNRRPA